MTPTRREPVRTLIDLTRRDPAWPIAVLRVVSVALVLELVVRRWELPRLATWAGIEMAAFATGSCPPPEPTTLEGRDLARAQLAAAIMRRWPFGRGPCLREALVVGRLLNHLHPELVVGVRDTDGLIEAHAWLHVAGEQLGQRDGFVPLEKHVTVGPGR